MDESSNKREALSALITKYAGDAEKPAADEEARGSPVVEETKETPTHLEIQVQNQDGSAVHFKVKETTSFGKMFSAYLSRQALSPASVRFLYDGVRLDASQTPKMVNMESGDVIDAIREQTGGDSGGRKRRRFI